MPESYSSKPSSDADLMQPADSGPASVRSPPRLIGRAVRRGRRALQTLVDLRRRSDLQRSARAPREQWLEDPACGAALVVVAHPDDDVITAAALLSRVKRGGVICVSDGAPRAHRYSESAGLPESLRLRRRAASRGRSGACSHWARNRAADQPRRCRPRGHVRDGRSGALSSRFPAGGLHARRDPRLRRRPSRPRRRRVRRSRRRCPDAERWCRSSNDSRGSRLPWRRRVLCSAIVPSAR